MVLGRAGGGDIIGGYTSRVFNVAFLSGELFGRVCVFVWLWLHVRAVRVRRVREPCCATIIAVDAMVRGVLSRAHVCC